MTKLLETEVKHDWRNDSDGGELRRLCWLCVALGAGGRYYADEYSRKVLRGFTKTGIIPEARLNYVTACCNWDVSSKFRRQLKELGIKFKSYWVEDCIEYMMRKEDYNLFRLSNTLSIRIYNPNYDIDINELYKKYLKDFNVQV